MNMLNVADVKWIEDKTEDMKKLSEKIDANISSTPEISEEKAGTLSKMKAFVRKAVDCCIE